MIPVTVRSKRARPPSAATLSVAMMKGIVRSASSTVPHAGIAFA
jgi:hypothetical protein